MPLADRGGDVSLTIDDLGGAEISQVLLVLGEARGDDLRAAARGELDREAADASAAADDQNRVPVRYLERIEGGKSRDGGQRGGACLGEVEPLRLRREEAMGLG